jgi:hypothetical protein
MGCDVLANEYSRSGVGKLAMLVFGKRVASRGYNMPRESAIE